MHWKILYIQYMDPTVGYPPLEHSSRMLAKVGYQVLFLGIDSLGAGEFRFRDHSNISVKRLTFCPGGWGQKFHYLWFIFWVLGWTLWWRPRWLYASEPLSCPSAWVLSYMPGLKLIYHEHDSPDPKFQHPISEIRYSIFMRFVLWTRKLLARRARVFILPNEKRIQKFEIATGSRNNVYCVWNCPSQEEIALPRPPRLSESLWVFYHGSLNPVRLPVTILEALALLPDSVKLRVVGYKNREYRDYMRQLKEKAIQLRVSKRVEVLGSAPSRGKLFEECRKCDVGVALMPKNSRDINEQTMAGASNKPFDYLANGLAVLVSNLPDWRELFVEPGYGLACDPDDPKSIAEALRWFLEHPREMREMGERGRQRIVSEWNYERQFSPVLEILNKTESAERGFGALLKGEFKSEGRGQ